MLMGAPLVTFRTKPERLTLVVSTESGGIAPFNIWSGLGFGPVALWQTWHVDLTICSPTR